VHPRGALAGKADASSTVGKDRAELGHRLLPPGSELVGGERDGQDPPRCQVPDLAAVANKSLGVVVELATVVLDGDPLGAEVEIEPVRTDRDVAGVRLEAMRAQDLQ
jgi:hypothetical protein